MTDTIIAAGVCLLDEQVEELAGILNEAAAALREQDGDLATRLMLWAMNVQADDDFDADFLAQSGRYVTGEPPGQCCRCGRTRDNDENFWYAVAEDENGNPVDVALCDGCHETLGRPSRASLDHCS